MVQDFVRTMNKMNVRFDLKNILHLIALHLIQGFTLLPMAVPCFIGRSLFL